jgi:4-hydroxy-3-methylbut-2-enyl diphosphate reductase
MGLITVGHDALNQLSGVKMLLRAHGEPPSTYELAKMRNIRLIDATCPVVLNLQKKLRVIMIQIYFVLSRLLYMEKMVMLKL